MIPKRLLLVFLWVFSLASLPIHAHATAVFDWFPSDGSASMGSLAIDAPDTGGFSVFQDAVIEYEFTFEPGLSVNLDDGFIITANVPIESFDGRFLDGGVFDLRFPDIGIVVFNTFLISGPDVTQYDPADENLVVRGNWVSRGVLPPPVPEPTTLALIGLGLAGIGYRRHRSNKAA